MKHLSTLLTTMLVAYLTALPACSGEGGGPSDDNSESSTAGSGGTSNANTNGGGDTSTATGSTADPCDACPGCCMGNGCVELDEQSEGACGRSGNQCEVCITGEVCVEGKCLVDSGQCSPASCPTGCCEGNVCVQRADQSWLACGTEAAECGTCNTATVCDEGTCTDVFAAAELLRLRIHEVQVETTDDGESWDVGGGAPDLFVCVTDGVFEGCTTVGSDTFAVDWGAEGALTDGEGNEVYFSTDDLVDGSLEYGVFDDDLVGRHLAHSGFLPAVSVFETEYSIAEQGPNLVALMYSFY